MICSVVWKKTDFAWHGVALISLIAMLPMLSWIISLYQPQAETQSLVYQLLAIGIAGMILFWPVSNIMPSVLRAAGDAYFTTVASLIAMWVFRVGMGYVISIPMGYGIRGIWYCMIAEWVVRCIFYVLRYRSGRWLQKKDGCGIISITRGPCRSYYILEYSGSEAG